MRPPSFSLSLLLFLIPAVACERPAETKVDPASRAVETPAEVGEQETARFRVVMLGDSLTAGQGLAKNEAFPALVQADLESHGWSVAVINGGVSGDTTAGGRARLAWLLAQRPDVVVVGLGANDGFRGVPADEVERNLRSIIQTSREAGSLVLLAGMQIPPNYGRDYSDRFAAIYPALASEFEIPLMPFLLEGVGGEVELNQADGIHPNAAGQRVIATALAPYVEQLLMQARDRGSA